MASRKEINELREEQFQKLQGFGESWVPTHPRLIGAPQRLPNEALSSWSWRIASRMRTSLKNILSIWGVDTHAHLMDSGVNFPDWKKVATSTGTPIKELESLQLCNPILLTSPEFSCLTHYKESKRPTYRYCHECLACDEMPYFRKEWRYSFFYVCPKHDCFMSDKCPACGEPIDLSRKKTTESHNVSSSSLRFCAHCESDLCKPRLVDVPDFLRRHLYVRQEEIQLLLSASQPNHLPGYGFGTSDPVPWLQYISEDAPHFLISFFDDTEINFRPTRETSIDALPIIADIRRSLRRKLFTYSEEFGFTNSNAH